MIRRLISLITVVYIIAFSGSGVFAADGCTRQNNILTVSGQCTLPFDVLPYRLSGIHVGPFGVLRILPGVRIELAARSAIHIQGALTTENGALPVVITSREADVSWNALLATGTIELRNVRFENFVGPLRIHTSRRILDGITLQDGMENVLEVGHSEWIELQSSALRAVYLRNVRRGSVMRSSSVRYLGSFGPLDVDGLHILDNRTALASDVFVGLEVRGPISQVGIRNITFPHGCFARFSGSTLLASLVPYRPEACMHPPLPVLFVPGYGTSIHLGVMVSPTPKYASDGWGFFASLTRPYADLLQMVEGARINHDVAYYDWRLPAAEGARQYLQPAIDRLKLRTGADAVHIIAHSFGGIVSREYIQGDDYRGDIASLTQLGTPNAGTPRAYAPWEGGVVPKEWESILHLVRYYKYVDTQKLSTVQTIRRHMPSLGELTPIYPNALLTKGVSYPAGLCLPNTTLQRLAASENKLLQRIPRITIFTSAERETLIRMNLEAADCNQDEWPDGASWLDEWAFEGDGTVPVASVGLSGVPPIFVSGNHAELPRTAGLQAIAALYPGNSTTQKDSGEDAVRAFIFDCPVEVIIRLPDGTTRNSATPDGEDHIGEVRVVPEMIWMVLPAQEGEYTATITAHTDTPIRGWVDGGEIVEGYLLTGETAVWTYSEKDGLRPSRTSEAPMPTTLAPTPSSSPDVALQVPQKQSGVVPLKESGNVLGETYEQVSNEESSTREWRLWPWLAIGALFGCGFLIAAWVVWRRC